MTVSRSEFARVYKSNRYKITGSEPLEREVDENYRYYLELVDLSGRDGDLRFMLNAQNEMTWEFSPRETEGASKG